MERGKTRNEEVVSSRSMECHRKSWKRNHLVQVPFESRRFDMLAHRKKHLDMMIVSVTGLGENQRPFTRG